MNAYVVLFAILFAVASVPAGGCAFVASRRGRDSWSAPLAFVLQLGGVFALFFGLVALAYEGYVEDAGMTPLRTLRFAVPLLAVAVVASAAAWVIALRRQARA